MNRSAYQAFDAARTAPIEKWEAILARTTDPKERAHMQIAINARKRLEAQKSE